MAAAHDLIAAISRGLLTDGWRRARGRETVFRRRYREPAGSYGVVWTKAVVVLTTGPDTQLDAFAASAWDLALGDTRWMMPPRGMQGGTLAMPVFIGPLSPQARSWATSQPQLRFATMCGPAAVDVATNEVVTDRDVPRLGAVLHRRRLVLADEISSAIKGSAAA